MHLSCQIFYLNKVLEWKHKKSEMHMAHYLKFAVYNDALKFYEGRRLN
jgi:pterin-4a-carbinolamine dehydratase